MALTFDDDAGAWTVDGKTVRLTDAIKMSAGEEASDLIDAHLDGIYTMLSRLVNNDGDPDELSDQIAVLATELSEVTFPVLMDSTELAARAGLKNPNTLYVYRRRGSQNVPEPICKLGVSDFWDRREALAWVRERQERDTLASSEAA